MKFKCIECGEPTKRKIDAYQYHESGLDNVYLQNIPIYECNCGAKYPSIFRVGYLNELIGEALLEKQSLLSGKEIKFLRKNLYLSSKDFANALGVGTTTLSKWENEKQRHRDTNDRLIRAVYLVYKGFKIDVAQKILKKLAYIKLEQTEIYYQIFAEFSNDEYIVNMQPMLGAFSPKIENILLNQVAVQVASSRLSVVSLNYSHMKIDYMFSSDEVLKTGSEPNEIRLQKELS
jgi:putative zinc finger/helix-turn-helix YgiT family protein